MKSTPYRVMGRLIVGGTIVIAILYCWMVYRENPRNGFLRTFNANALSEASMVELDRAGYYFAGYSGARVHFGNHNLPDHVLSADLNLANQSLEVYLMPTPVRWAFVDVAVYRDSLYFMDRSMNIVCSGPTDRKRGGFSFKRLSYPFSRCMPLDTDRYVLMVIDTLLKQFNLAIYRLSDSSIRIVPFLDRQSDGYFSVDGLLRQIPNTNKLVYTYFYRNAVLLLNDSLQRENSFQTIDTVTIFNNSAQRIHDGRMLTLARPTNITNRYSSIYKNYLLIQSGLRADNEGKHTFSSNSVVDVYDLTSRKYRFSFYIPHPTRNDISSMGIADSTLIVTYKDRFAASFRVMF